MPDQGLHGMNEYCALPYFYYFWRKILNENEKFCK